MYLGEHVCIFFTGKQNAFISTSGYNVHVLRGARLRILYGETERVRLHLGIPRIMTYIVHVLGEARLRVLHGETERVRLYLAIPSIMTYIVHVLGGARLRVLYGETERVRLHLGIPRIMTYIVHVRGGARLRVLHRETERVRLHLGIPRIVYDINIGNSLTKMQYGKRIRTNICCLPLKATTDFKATFTVIYFDKFGRSLK